MMESQMMGGGQLSQFGNGGTRGLPGGAGGNTHTGGSKFGNNNLNLPFSTPGPAQRSGYIGTPFIGNTQGRNNQNTFTNTALGGHSKNLFGAPGAGGAGAGNGNNNNTSTNLFRNNSGRMEAMGAHTAMRHDYSIVAPE